MGEPAKQVPLDAVRYGRLIGLPPGCMVVLRRLQDAGHRALLCGGTVRDLMAGGVPQDLDLCTSATPAAARRILPGAMIRADQAGESLGTLALVEGSREMELTTFRVEGEYQDHRQPATVRFVAGPEQDFPRRDFTVNALYLDPFAGTVLDPCGGLEDLAARRLRAIGDPAVRLREDVLRVLRALRLCAEHDFVMERDTWDACCGTAPLVSRLSGARIFDELTRLFVARGRARGLELLVTSGIAAVVLPEVAALAGVPQPESFHPEGDVLRHTALVLAELRDPVDPVLAWAAVLHDTGKPDTFVEGPDRIRFDGHDAVSARIAKAWLERLGASARLTAEIVAIVAEHIRVASVPRFRLARRNRFLADPLCAKHLAFHRADCLGSHRQLDIHDELRRWRSELPPGLPRPLVRGRDLLALGIPPGPAMGRLLARLEEARYSGEVGTAAEALALARELWRNRSG